ncbi:Ribosomal-protein-S5p-alanine acetyltransferase [Pseudomonas sp. R1-43-08]|nr:Ribosomal-protein-S5p-alanine acetyltransferase [Pseudomonas sp. R1-43-08]
MEYSGEGFFLRTLTSDDFELINRYEKVNRRHLQRWEPLRDEQYFTSESARERVQQQFESMQAGGSIFFSCWNLRVESF